MSKKIFHLSPLWGALKKRAELETGKSVFQNPSGNFMNMHMQRLRFGLGYALIGAWITCTLLRVMGIIGFDSLVPVILYLGLGTLVMGLLAAKGMEFRFKYPPPIKGALPTHEISQEISHEIKNYLCTLKGNALLLRQRGGMGDQGPILDRIDRVVEKLEGFARNLGNPLEGVQPTRATSEILVTTIDSTHTGLKSKTANRIPVKMSEVVRECSGTHFHEFRETFVIDAEEGDGEILGDPDRLEQVFLNLYLNAREAGSTKIMTRITREGSRILVTVEDDGKGCHAQDLKRIFEPFFSTKSGSTRRGLGMFIVQSIIESHGGKIHVHTKNDALLKRHGLIFTLELPILFPAPLASLPPQQPMPQLNRASLSFPRGASYQRKPKQPRLPAPT